MSARSESWQSAGNDHKIYKLKLFEKASSFSIPELYCHLDDKRLKIYSGG